MRFVAVQIVDDDFARQPLDYQPSRASAGQLISYLHNR